uniref:Enoyl reductase (ER) domain-containing protein n=1 Tax=Chromera velia CCMP2878 TaxID=1169474 RepID=A0A0G4FWA3_9ALVE|eukprot:Cvel_19070.t1-p1 / transcript=Cvel_19070.t1 / gene=Cvel_19070 / organism=Chromera_velia_CCMP2878 / gene_product=Succinate-semialdehyde dehydrogenase (acetylating), putative / transcript_product=Succinate-semialdehyde dehydrogenase (acetylating), putative / location=Cvel_scaffold1618:29858-32970(+) / protein_length=420 / sequence_SO=supercontig / SO=protein_coding / is_pseudo=false
MSGMRGMVMRGACAAGKAVQDVMRMEKIRMPIPKAGEALVKVSACGVCHSDLHVLLGEIPFPQPAVLGHEIVGKVVGFGPGVDDSVQKRLKSSETDSSFVVAPFIMPCGSCHDCLSGNEEICSVFFETNRGKGGLHDGTSRYVSAEKDGDAGEAAVEGEVVKMYSMGGLSDFTVVPVSSLFRLDVDRASEALGKEVSPAHTAILGCAVFTAFGAVRNTARLQAGESICVVGGGGGVGSAILQLAQVVGAFPRVAVDVSEEKLRACTEKFGATHTVNAAKMSREEVIETVRTIGLREGISLSHGVTGGVDCVFEALGRPDTFELSVMLARDGGRTVMVGLADTQAKAQVPITHLVRRRISVLGSYGAKTRKDMPALVRLVEGGRLDVGSFIDKEFKFDQAAEAYEELRRGVIKGRAVVKMD